MTEKPQKEGVVSVLELQRLMAEMQADIDQGQPRTRFDQGIVGATMKWKRRIGHIVAEVQRPEESHE